MTVQPSHVAVVTAFVIAISILVKRWLSSQHAARTDRQSGDSRDAIISRVNTELRMRLESALPDRIVLPQHESFKRSMNSYWAQQECEVVPACAVRPLDTRELSKAVKIIEAAYDERMRVSGLEAMQPFFAVRSGGHSPIAGAASVEGGVVIDMSFFREVTPSEDGQSVVIGAGAKWMDVSNVLDAKGLAVVGGRNSAVGVGGLILGGGLSFFSPRLGLVCSNIISYEIVLASGDVTIASASTNQDLWRALKGGTNNFGIVTRFTARAFPATKIWSGFLYMTSHQATKALTAFYDCVQGRDRDGASITFDQYAAGPMLSFTYLQKLGIEVVAVNLVYTKTSEKQKGWPVRWKQTSFGSLWRLWSTCKTRSLTSATDELNSLNPPGRRQAFATTTVKNDPATLTAIHTAYKNAITTIRNSGIKDISWTVVVQPLLPDWVHRGDANVLGLQDNIHEPLVIVVFPINWAERQDDEYIHSVIRRTIEQIDTFAIANKTSHRYRYINYCAEWQQPFQSYGEESLRFLREVSRKYDADGLFQKGCSGGFKLGMTDQEYEG